MSGVVTLRARLEIPPGERPFLEKVKLRGNFGIGGGEFSHVSTQEGVNKLSAGALGEKNTSDPETVLTDLTGKVSLDNGVAEFAEHSFGVPGAAAGSYDFKSHKIDEVGKSQRLVTVRAVDSVELHGRPSQQCLQRELRVHPGCDRENAARGDQVVKASLPEVPLQRGLREGRGRKADSSLALLDASAPASARNDKGGVGTSARLKSCPSRSVRRA
jgi:hypothetical protein